MLYRRRGHLSSGYPHGRWRRVSRVRQFWRACRGNHLLGWAMQHYYLDAQIWRVRRDPSIENNVYTHQD